ncbi:ABC transporter ATP-binding protein [Enterococcus sp. LJL98]
MVDAIEIMNVTKKFKDTIALNQVSLTFERGKIHGIIGRNGSGKTVLFKCICGFMKVDEGKIILNGKEVKVAATQDMGIILENPGFIGSMSGFKNLKLLASIKRKITDEKIKEAIRRVGLDPQEKKHVSKYSLGMRHRLAIAQAIMEEPEILLLDEPMNGLDRYGVIEIRNLLKDLRETGTTILIASHYAEDIQELCDTVHEMDQGRVLEEPQLFVGS